MLMTTGLNHGVKSGIPHMLGIVTGGPLMIAAVGFGLGAIFLRYPVIHQILKVIGITYLLFLAWKIANAGNPDAANSLKRPLTFVQSFAFQWANPKAWVVTIGALSAFTTQENLVFDILVLILGFMILGVSCMALWLILGASLQKILQKEKHLRYFNISMAALLALSVVPMIGS